MDQHLRRRSISASSLGFCCFFLFAVAASADRFDISTVPFADGFRPLFGDGNCAPSDDGQGVSLLLDRFTGAGFISADMYQHGFYSAKIKLPSDYTAGVVVALPNYLLIFHHDFNLFPHSCIKFYVDEVPIREIKKTEAMGSDYPSKPMSLYATIWDASDWATSGGRFKVNYKYAPFIAKFTDLSLEGCPIDPAILRSSATADVEAICSDSAALLESKKYSAVTPSRRAAMRRFRQRYMYYYYCYDSIRYPIAPPECVIDPVERARYHDTGRLKFGGSHKRRSRRTSNPTPVDYGNIDNQDDVL